MLSSLKHMSPFDVNMALDAGFDSVTSYGSVTLDEITPLVQDAMFSRSSRDAARTSIFFGGNDAGLALDMMEQLKATLLKPFEISSVTLAGYDGLARVQAKANDIKKRFGVDVHAVDASTPEK